MPAAVSAIKVDGETGLRPGQEPANGGAAVASGAGSTKIRVHDVVGDEVRFSVRCSSGTYVRAPRARPGGAARDRWPPDGAAAYRSGALHPGPGPHAGPAGVGVRHTRDVRRPSACPSPRASSTRRRPPTWAFGRKLPIDLGQPGPVDPVGPDGGFLALYAQEGDCARAVAVFV